MTPTERVVKHRALKRGCASCGGTGKVLQSPNGHEMMPCRSCRPTAFRREPAPLPGGLTETDIEAMEARSLHLPSRRS